MDKKKKITIIIISALIIALAIIGAVILINYTSKLEEKKINEESIVFLYCKNGLF